MAALVLSFLVFLAFMAAHSSANYCVCRDGLSESVYQRDIDYACGAGADCSAITQNGACYNPNTVKAHCDYAVNSYYQKKGQTSGSCDFSSSATVTASVPAQSSGCSFPSSATGGGGGGTTTTPSTTTPSTTTPSTTTPNTGGTTTTTPNTGGTSTTNPGFGTGTGTGTGTGNNPNAGPGVFGLGPTGSGITNTDSNDGTTLLRSKKMLWFYTFALGTISFVITS